MSRAPWLAALALLACTGARAQQTIALDCCAVLNSLYGYMKVADRYACKSPDSACASVKLVQLFVEHSRAAAQGVNIHAQGAQILVTMPSDDTLRELLVFAFFGRAAAPSASTEVDLWLSYDTKHEKIVFEDSTCAYNRNVYTLLVLSSIVLLMFFIGVQVAKKDETEQRLAAAQRDVSTHQAFTLPALVARTDTVRFRTMNAPAAVGLKM